MRDDVVGAGVLQQRSLGSLFLHALMIPAFSLAHIADSARRRAARSCRRCKGAAEEAACQGVGDSE